MATGTPHFYYKGSRLKQLRAFCASAKLQSMSKAAEQLHVSQPTISLQVRSLEEEFNAVLFERRGPRIRLTSEGKALYELARPLVDGIDALPDAFERSLGTLDVGELDIAAGESTIMYLLPSLLETFRQRYPDIHVHLHNVTGRDGMRMIREDEVEFAVGSMLEVPNDIDYQPLYSFDPALIMPLDHPLAGREHITLQDISPYGLILPPRRLTTWRLIDLVFHEHQVPYEVVIEVGGWEVIKHYVELGHGISIVTSICLSDEDRLATYNLSEWFPSRSYGIVMRKNRYLSPPAKRFLEVIIEASEEPPGPG